LEAGDGAAPRLRERNPGPSRTRAQTRLFGMTIRARARARVRSRETRINTASFLEAGGAPWEGVRVRGAEDGEGSLADDPRSLARRCVIGNIARDLGDGRQLVARTRGPLLCRSAFAANGLSFFPSVAAPRRPSLRDDRQVRATGTLLPRNAVSRLLDRTAELGI
jgi:hypothetical protein